MERDITKIAKAQYLIPELKKGIEKIRDKIKIQTAEIALNPIHRLEWSDSLFENAAALGIIEILFNYVEDRANQIDPEKLKTEWTMDELKALVMKSHFGHARAVPKSTSACSNLMEQYKLDALQKFCNGYGYVDDRFFYDAQWNDPEWNEEYDRRAKAAKAAREAKEAEEAAAKKAAAAAKRAATRAANKAARRG